MGASGQYGGEWSVWGRVVSIGGGGAVTVVARWLPQVTRLREVIHYQRLREIAPDWLSNACVTGCDWSMSRRRCISKMPY